MRNRRTPPPWREVRAGLLLAVGITAASTTIFFTDQIRRSIQEGPILTVSTPAAPGLHAGSDVWVAGRLVGRVISVSFQPPAIGRAGNVVIRAVLHRSAGEYVRRDATATIRPSDLLAPVVLAIDPGSPGEPALDFADTLRTGPADADLERVLALLDSLRDNSARAAPIGRRLAEEMRSGRGSLAAFRRDTTVRRLLQSSRERVRTLRTRRGSLARLATDSLIVVRLDSVMRRAARLAAVRETLRVARAAEAWDLGATLERLRTRLATIDRRLAEGRGSAGRAIHDDEILRQAKLLRARLDTVVVELSRNPLRWLRFRIF